MWRSTAKFCGLLPTRTRLSSLRNAISNTQCTLFSMPQCSRTAAPNCLASPAKLVM